MGQSGGRGQSCSHYVFIGSPAAPPSLPPLSRSLPPSLLALPSSPFASGEGRGRTGEKRMATDKEDFHFSFLFSLYFYESFRELFLCYLAWSIRCPQPPRQIDQKLFRIIHRPSYSLSLQNDSIEWESFTFDKFYQIYKIICPRSDIDDLFQSM